MADDPLNEAGYDREDSYFHEKDLELLAKKRAQLDTQRKGQSIQSLTCPRCGSSMNEVSVEHVKIDRCTSCGGIFLDKGELDVLTHAKSGGIFKRLFGR